jgi:hypothetical protein
VAISVIVTFGDTRYRTTFEVVLAILASVTLNWLWTASRSERRSESTKERGLLGRAYRPAGRLPESAGWP